MKNFIYLIGGMSATGKTTLGKELSKKLKLPFLDKDLLCDPITNFILKEKFNSHDRSLDYYKQNIRDLEYKILFDQIKAHAQLGIGVVAVSPFSSEFTSKTFLPHFVAEIAEINPKIKVLPILLYLNQETASQRISKRNRKEDEGKLKDFYNFYQEYNKKEYNKLIELKIENTNTKESIDKILNFTKNI